jgi:hypothetical protein
MLLYIQPIFNSVDTVIISVFILSCRQALLQRLVRRCCCPAAWPQYESHLFLIIIGIVRYLIFGAFDSFSLMSFRPIQYVRYEIKLSPLFIARLIFYERMLLYLTRYLA